MLGKEIRVFESGSMMQYIARRYDTEHKISFPVGSREDVEVRHLLHPSAPRGPRGYPPYHSTLTPSPLHSSILTPKQMTNWLFFLNAGVGPM